MKKDFQKYTDFLLDNAPPNIKYRVKKEILNESISSADMLDLQEKLLSLPKVKKCFACQNENGFIGSVIHGVYFYPRTALSLLYKRCRFSCGKSYKYIGKNTFMEKQ